MKTNNHNRWKSTGQMWIIVWNGIISIKRTYIFPPHLGCHYNYKSIRILSHKIFYIDETLAANSYNIDEEIWTHQQIVSAVFIYSIIRECMFTLFYELITIQRYQWVNAVHLVVSCGLAIKLSIFSNIWIANNNIIYRRTKCHMQYLLILSNQVERIC